MLITLKLIIVIRPLADSRVASPYQISTKSIHPLWGYCKFSIFQLVTLRHVRFVWHPFEHPQGVLGGLYHCAKFGYNRGSSFDNMTFLYLVNLAGKCIFTLQILGVWGYLTKAKKARYCVSPRHWSHKIGYISPICSGAPHRRISTKYCTVVEVVDIIICDRVLAISLGTSNLWGEVEHWLFSLRGQLLLVQGCITVQS